jgi:phenylalanine-4-hydroxylase
VVKEDPAATPGDRERAEARLRAALAGRTYVSESTRASRLYWWTAEYGLVGGLDQPRLYGAGLLSSIGEASQCLGSGVRRLPLSLACVDQDFDITRMQPQLYVARDFDQLFEVLEAFEATLAWKRGGDYGLEEARRAGTVNHLLLADGRELTGRVAGLVQRGRGDRQGAGLRTLLAQLEGPVMVSRGGTAEPGPPWAGTALVAFGAGPDPGPGTGPFRLACPGGLSLAGIRVGGHGVAELRGEFRGRPLALPDSALLFLAEGLPGVAGGPGDPEAWDRWFGDPDPVQAQGAEIEARRRKAEALPAPLAALYLEVAAMRAAGLADHERLGRIRQALAQFPEDWLLASEVGELLGDSGT